MTRQLISLLREKSISNYWQKYFSLTTLRQTPWAGRKKRTIVHSKFVVVCWYHSNTTFAGIALWPHHTFYIVCWHLSMSSIPEFANRKFVVAVVWWWRWPEQCETDAFWLSPTTSTYCLCRVVHSATQPSNPAHSHRTFRAIFKSTCFRIPNSGRISPNSPRTMECACNISLLIWPCLCCDYSLPVCYGQWEYIGMPFHYGIVVLFIVPSGIGIR